MGRRSLDPVVALRLPPATVLHPSGMRLLLDQNLSAHAAALLRERGFDVVHAREVALSTSADEEPTGTNRSGPMTEISGRGTGSL